MVQFPKNTGFPALKAAVAVLALPALLGGCTSITDRRGYVADPVLTGAITPGLDNRESVRGTLGQPSFTSQFGDPVYYYVASTTEQRVFGQPQIEVHQVIKVAFDPSGTVNSVTFAGKDDVRDINPDGDKTPTLGRHRGFLQDLFGNIGAVGAAGAAPVGGPNGS
ncbi:outer membrane protein assembly factor BamE [Croceicoccus ponticola]|uniref:Outer membrane protein assembly factor BamE n=1 Tax=Croceicoccus ponticola TaxID=2217664 RepID=A0A437GYU7_9SPHN|nr:outer membrane protein assembly factor BamE [Croceicoccus ponticola]RVQ67829.1 outer membrane protein assembly factor BamE [Croceicoccus ponticola]